MIKDPARIQRALEREVAQKAAKIPTMSFSRSARINVIPRATGMTIEIKGSDEAVRAAREAIDSGAIAKVLAEEVFRYVFGSKPSP